MELASRVVDMNYPNLFENTPIDASDHYSFPDSPLHRAYADTKLALLTDDMRAIRMAVNSYLELGGAFAIKPRIEIELPMLAAEARELIEMLKAEYPESRRGLRACAGVTHRIDPRRFYWQIVEPSRNRLWISSGRPPCAPYGSEGQPNRPEAKLHKTSRPTPG
jgi:hypothetical protein